VNVIWEWLDHICLETTNRDAKINIRMKQEALEAYREPFPGEIDRGLVVRQRPANDAGNRLRRDSGDRTLAW